MQARGPLMMEHRLIERMLGVVGSKLEQVRTWGLIDPHFVDIVIDFILVYADRTHHGKEEEILFKNLEKKNMSAEDRRVMNELVEEHALGRKTTRIIEEANKRYRNGDALALDDIVLNLNVLVNFYPRHIEKEDKVFFPAALAYFSNEDDQAMLADFWEFDRRMIHEKYKSVVEWCINFEGRTA